MLTSWQTEIKKEEMDDPIVVSRQADSFFLFFFHVGQAGNGTSTYEQ